EHIGGEGEFRWRPVLGNSGFLSVLRDQGGGEYYRSSVQLGRFDMARELEAPGAFQAGLQAGAKSGASAAVKALFPGSDLEVLARYPVAFQCSCSKERVKNALLAMGRAELDDL